MTDIKLIPISELVKDLKESQRDVIVCELALEKGITIYSGGQVQERLDTNRLIVIKIEEEIERRCECSQ